MDTETTTESGVVAETNEGEGNEVEASDITLSKVDYDKLNQTIGSFKKEIKDLKKAQSEVKSEVKETKETPKETEKTQPEDSDLLQKTFLRAAQITDEGEVEMTLETSKKWDMPLDKLVDDEDFKIKLEKHRTAKTNVEATTNVRGSNTTSQAKDTPEYWLAKGTLPTREDIPDRKARAKIQRAFMAKETTGKTFYND